MESNSYLCNFAHFQLIHVLLRVNSLPKCLIIGMVLYSLCDMEIQRVVLIIPLFFQGIQALIQSVLKDI